MTTLTTLPSEVRLNIYHFCNVIVRGEIVPYPTSATYHSACVLGGHQVSRKLDVALLAVNKLVRVEVSPILYGENIWRMTIPKVVSPSFSIGHDVFRVQPLLFRHIAIDFDCEDLPRDFKHATIARARQRYGETADSFFPNAAISKFVHERSCGYLHVLWVYQCRLIEKMDLNRITCNLQHCRCPSGCCSLISQSGLRIIFSGDRNLCTEIRRDGPQSPEAERFLDEMLTISRGQRWPAGGITLA